MPVVPKKRFTRFLTRRRHLLQYVNHYRFLFKVRREHFDRRRYMETLYDEKYVSPPFRHPGFWPGTFGFPRIQAVQDLIGDNRDTGGGGSSTEVRGPGPPGRGPLGRGEE
uniref:Uncharacterized protein n=1 Tax=Pyrodinium bahamense TaxID=73915 RepID=A0A7S0FM08_9DINO|mmetsp:Transcript_37443/g.104049  ORF Transcript_37443/g.104049 Transcript_37443/m.104049 type:complete len:110 (+) Transcript_37443:89-418(+)